MADRVRASHDAAKAASSSSKKVASTGPSNSARLASVGNGTATALAQAMSSVARADSLLPHLDRIQASFGHHDVTHARASVGGQGATAAEAINARAFTIGSRVAFDASPDLRVAAHEAAHVIQQRRGLRLERGIGSTSDMYERHAESVAQRVSDGASAAALLDALPSGDRHCALQRDTTDVHYDPLAEQVSEAESGKSLDLDEQAEFDQALGWRSAGAMPVQLHPDEPTSFLVPSDASYEEIAAGIGTGEGTTRTDWFEVVPLNHAPAPPDTDHKSVRVRDVAWVEASLAGNMRAELDRQIASDAQFVADKLIPNAAGSAHWAAVQRTLVWGDRSSWTGGGGRSYFDLFLDRLDAIKLEQPHWYTLGQTSDTKSALEWLLEESGQGYWMLRRMIAMRSSRQLPGTDHMFKGASLARGSPLGFAFVSGRAWTIVVDAVLLTEHSMASAMLAARNSPYLGLRVVVPASTSTFIVYAAKPVLGTEGGDFRRTEFDYKTWMEKERYVFNFPGVGVVYPDSFSSTQPVGADKDRDQRQLLLFQAISAAPDDPKAILGLDLDVLAEADTASRKEIFSIILDKAIDEPGGFELLARLIIATPSDEFLSLEKQLITVKMIKRLAYKSGSGRALLGRAYTMKALEVRPLGAESLDSLPEYHVGQEDSTKWWVDVFPEETTSEAIAPEAWKAEGATTIGHEPALPGQQPGQIPQTALRFRETKHVTPWYGFGASTDRTDLSHSYHPSQLLRVTFKGTPDTLIASAFELAMIGPVTRPWREVFLPGVMKVVNLWMIYSGARGFIGGLSAASLMTRGGLQGAELAVAEEAAAQLVGKTVRRFLFDVVVLGGSTAVNAYRDELEKTAAGRAFVTVFDVAMLGLTAKDVYRLFSSGVLQRRIASAGTAIAELGAAAPQRLLEVYDGWRAFSSTMASWLKRGLVTIAKTTTGHNVPVPVDEPGFLAMFRTARAELAGQRVLGGLTAAGRATDIAQEVLGRLKDLAEANSEFAKAYSAVARRAARLAPGEVTLLLKRVAAVLDARKGLAGKLGGFLGYAMRFDDALAALAHVEALAGHTGLSDEAIAVLAKKAGANRVDIAWLNGLDLDSVVLDFLARDPNCPWRLFKRAAEDPFDTVAEEAVGKALRGYAGELLAQTTLGKVLPRFSILGRQAQMRSS